jgi:uncharacterized UBP type Zn finger protein
MIDYPDELDTDDIEELASYIERRYPTEEIRVHDTETIHFAYWDKSHRVVSATLLDHIQAAGYQVLHTGVATIPRGATRRAWMECRKHEPGADERTMITVFCDHCEEEFTADEARTIAIFGPDDVCYTCPQCGYGADGPSPILSTK